MRAVILAAGRGGRLQDVTGPLPKCLMKIGGESLLERQIRTLRTCGVDRITVVAGYCADIVAAVAGPRVDIVLNEQFASTNSLYSLSLARQALTDGFLVLNCDVLFPAAMLEELLSCSHDNALLFARREEGAEFGDEEMKVHVQGGVVVAIDKMLPAANADGENVGIARFGSAGAAVLLAHVDRILGEGGVREWLPRAFDAFCRERRLASVDTRGLPWIEIDFPQDYWRACRDVLPAIEALDGVPYGRATRSSRERGAGVRRAIHHV